MHPWHEAPNGYAQNNFVNALIEISSGMRTKYELDKETGLLKLDRILYASICYPANYGIIPQTLSEDLDPLDIMILCQETIQPMTLVPARIIGVMKMIDQGKIDDKILAVPINDIKTSHIHDISDLNLHVKSELKEFFETYTRLENKTVTVTDFQRKAIAGTLIETAITNYQKKFKE